MRSTVIFLVSAAIGHYRVDRVGQPIPADNSVVYIQQLGALASAARPVHTRLAARVSLFPPGNTGSKVQRTR